MGGGNQGQQKMARRGGAPARDNDGWEVLPGMEENVDIPYQPGRKLTVGAQRRLQSDLEEMTKTPIEVALFVPFDPTEKAFAGGGCVVKRQRRVELDGLP